MAADTASLIRSCHCRSSSRWGLSSVSASSRLNIAQDKHRLALIEANLQRRYFQGVVRRAPSKPWTDKDTDILVRYTRGSVPVAQLAGRLGRTPAAIRA